MALTIGLVGCGKLKRERPVPARALYTSALFRLASAYCAASCDRWFILSAKNGLLGPDTVTTPYDLTLADLGEVARAAWAVLVATRLHQLGLLDAGHRFELHAGALYADPLARHLEAEQPLRGLTIGRRLAWYKSRLAALAPSTKQE